jgi:glutaredoxin
MTKLRINCGGSDLHADLTVQEFEEMLSSGQEFITMPILFFDRPHSILRVRPNQIRYYFEEL